MRRIEAGMQFWPDQAGPMRASQVIKMYEAGFAGAWADDETRAEFQADITANGGQIRGVDAAYAGGFAGVHAGKLLLPFLYAEQLYPGLFPGAAQERGDCVSHDEKNANIITICGEIISGVPDEVTGIIEGPFEVSPEGVREGLLSSEYPYWFRGYSSDGWNCDAATAVTLKHGVLIRKAYPELGIDLTNYSGSLAGKYGRSEPPANISAEGRLHLVRTATEIESAEECRDMLGESYGVSSCGGEGFSNQRDANGVASRSGRWSHAMAYIGFDDRPEIHRIYGGPLVLVQNSWGIWNGGPRRILGTTIDIPQGSFWARWKDVQSRYMIARSGVNGWQRRSLPDLGIESQY